MPTVASAADDPAKWPCGKSCWFYRTEPRNATLFQQPVDVQELPFCALEEEPPGSNITLVVEAWSDRNDLGDKLGELLASSKALSFSFDDRGFADTAAFVNFSGVQQPSGWVTIAAHAQDPAWYEMARLISWSGYVPTTTDANPLGLPTFAGDSGILGDAYTTTEFSPPSINVSYSQPGVRFVGIFQAYSSAYDTAWYASGTKVHTDSWPRDLRTGKVFQPFAVVTPWENGTVPSLPAGFDGPMVVTRPIPGDWRLALRVDQVTVFNGGVIYLRAVNGVPSTSNGGGESSPQVVELEVPNGLRVVVPPGSGVTCCSGFHSVTDVSAVPGGGEVLQGYTRLRLDKKPEYEWSYQNAAIEVRVEVDRALAGKHFPAARVRAYSGTRNQRRSDNWQQLRVTVKALEPVPVLPKRLHTSFCYAAPRLFVDAPSAGLSSITTWRDLGFNTVPNAGSSYFAKQPATGATPGGTPKVPVLSPANRSSAEWAGMKYGLMTTPFTPEGLSAPPYGLGAFSALTMPVAAASSSSADGFNFSSVGLTHTEEVAERRKWRNALEFYETYKTLDLSYDGWFVQHDLWAIQQLVNYTQADYLSMDIETLPQLEQWIERGFRSANFAKAKLPGERDSEALVRLGASWVAGVAAAARSVQPHIKVYFYNIWARFDAGFQSISWPMAASIGLADMPSYYERPIQNDLRAMAANVRAERLAVGTAHELIPWLTPGQTAGTDGPHSLYPGLALFNSLIHLFCAGATGFNMFDSDGMYDMAMWLAIRDAIALVAPYEDLVLDGRPAPTHTFANVSSSAVVLSAMVSSDGNSMLIASSTVPPGLPAGFTIVPRARAEGLLLCDLTNMSVGEGHSSGAGMNFAWFTPAETGSVLLLAAKTPCHHPVANNDAMP